MNTTWTSTSSGNNTQLFNLSYIDMKVAGILAELYLSDDESMAHYYFYNNDFYKIPEGKVLRIRIDIVDKTKLVKKNKKKL